jgi:hypothetical protein
MTRILSILLLSTFAAIAAPKDALLEFDYPASELTTNVTFYLRSTNDISAPLATWPVVQVLNSGTNRFEPVPMTGGWRFFYATASNEWGESLPSNTLTTQVFRAVSNMTIRPK